MEIIFPFARACIPAEAMDSATTVLNHSLSGKPSVSLKNLNMGEISISTKKKAVLILPLKLSNSNNMVKTNVKNKVDRVGINKANTAHIKAGIKNRVDNMFFPTLNTKGIMAKPMYKLMSH